MIIRNHDRAFCQIRVPLSIPVQNIEDRYAQLSRRCNWVRFGFVWREPIRARELSAL
jgi:hypothetical protein